VVSPTVYELILEPLIAPAISMCRSQATGESMTSIPPAKGVTLHMRGLSGSRLNMTGHRTGILSEKITRKVEPCHGTFLWNICRAVGSPRSCMCCAIQLCRSAWWSCWQHPPSFREPFGLYRATLLLPPICASRCNVIITYRHTGGSDRHVIQRGAEERCPERSSRCYATSFNGAQEPGY
jgi:hypothetical protein